MGILDEHGNLQDWQKPDSWKLTDKSFLFYRNKFGDVHKVAIKNFAERKRFPHAEQKSDISIIPPSDIPDCIVLNGKDVKIPKQFPHSEIEDILRNSGNITITRFDSDIHQHEPDQNKWNYYDSKQCSVFYKIGDSEMTVRLDNLVVRKRFPLAEEIGGYMPVPTVVLASLIVK